MRSSKGRGGQAGLIVAGLLVLGVVCRAADEPRAWAPAVLDALRAYHDGQLELSQGMAQRVLSGDVPQAARRDAQALIAMCLLRSPARSDCLEGRARLAELAREDPAYEDEPECNLAYGIGQTTLAETAKALDALAAAADAFAARGQPQRYCAALAALAATWARHTEWELTPPRFGVALPAGVDAANAARRERIEALIEQLRGLPENDEALATAELVLARYLLDTGQDTGQARGILARLAAAPRLRGPWLEAAGLHARACEDAGRIDAAIQLYERIGAEGSGEWAREAAERLRTLREPQLELDVAARARGGVPVDVHLRARGVRSVRLEVRQVDLEPWLASAKTRGLEEMLAEAGSLHAAQDFDVGGVAPGAWWDTTELDPSPRLELPAGSYAVVARAGTAAGRELAVKRLLIVSDLEACCVVGRKTALLYVALPAGMASAPTARFWMQPSFTATKPVFEGSLARFALPAEAFIMQDKRWLCLVRAGEQLALLRGRLTTETPIPRVFLTAGPPAPEVGQTLYVAGRLLHVETAADIPGDTRPLRIELVDAADRLVDARDVVSGPLGTFSAAFPIGVELGGRHLRVIPRAAGRVLENVAGRVSCAVPEPDAAEFRVRLSSPTWLRGDAAVLEGLVQAEYPWGTRPRTARVHGTFQAAVLPGPDALGTPRTLDPLEWSARLDRSGRGSFALSSGELGVSGVPMVIGVEARVDSQAGRSGVGYAEVLLSHERPYAWLACEPAEARVGEPLRLGVGWFDPDGMPASPPGRLVIRRDEGILAELPLEPGGAGLISPTWVPREPGHYQVRAEVPVVGRAPLAVSRALRVAPGAMRGADGPQVRCTARLAEADAGAAVLGELTGTWSGPLLAVLEAGEPMAAVPLPGLDGSASFTLPLEGNGDGGLRVRVLGFAASAARELAVADVAVPAAPIRALRLKTATADVWPGSTVTVTAECDAGGEFPAHAALMLRLARVTSSVLGGQRGTARWSDLGPPTPATVSSGPTLWCEGAEITAPRMEFPVPIPAEPGLYLVSATLWPSAGAAASETLLLDARRGVRLWLDVPRQMTVGDRTIMAVGIENGDDEPLSLTVRLDPGAGLTLESVRGLGDGATVASDKLGQVAVELGVGAQVWLHATVEAAVVGDGSASAVVVLGDRQSHARRPYAVVSAISPSGSAEVVTIRRTLEVWRAAGADRVPGSDEAASFWLPQRWAPGDRLQPGDLVQVREEFDVRGPGRDFIWVQRLPPTCWAPEGARFRGTPVGEPLGGPGDALRFQVSSLGAGAYTHEYFVEAVRPGVASLPVPSWHGEGTPATIRVEPDDLRLIVLDE